MKKLLLSAATILSVGGVMVSAPLAHALSNPAPKQVAIINLAAASTTPLAAPAAPAPASPAPVMVQVQLGDYLEKIASDHNTTYLRLYYANTDIQDQDLIFPGQSLRIPADDEQLTARPLAASAPVEAVAAVAANPAADTAPVARTNVASAAPATNFDTSDGGVWDRIAACESGGNWAINTGNGYYGGLQFNVATWAGYDGYATANLAPKSVQIEKAQQVQAARGWSPWTCAAMVGIY